MKLEQMKELADLKEEIESREDLSTQLYREKVEPLRAKKEAELVDAFRSYFESNGMEITEDKTSASVIFQAKYKTLSFAVLKSHNGVNLHQDNSMIASVFIKTNSYRGGTTSIPQDPFLAEKAQLQLTLDGIETNIEKYSNPEVYYEYNGRRLEDASDLVSKIFS